MNMSDLPVAGSMLVAHRSMRAWVSETERGENGLHVVNGDSGLVLHAWRINTRVRIRMLIKDAVVMFSHVDNCVWLNWSVLTDYHPSDP